MTYSKVSQINEHASYQEEARPAATAPLYHSANTQGWGRRFLKAGLITGALGVGFVGVAGAGLLAGSVYGQQIRDYPWQSLFVPAAEPMKKDPEIASMLAEIDGTLGQVKAEFAARESLNVIVEEKNRLHASLQDLRQQNADLSNENTVYKQQVADITQKLESAVNAKASLAAQLKKSDSRIQELTQELAAKPATTFASVVSIPVEPQATEVAKAAPPSERLSWNIIGMTDKAVVIMAQDGPATLRIGDRFQGATIKGINVEQGEVTTSAGTVRYSAN